MSARDRMTGLSLAGLVVLSWGGLLWLTLAVVDWSVWWPLAPVGVAAQCWLYVGLFIVVHDAIHTTLAPGWPGVNRAIGRVCAFLYAGFDFDALAREHHAHHQHSGTVRDPDFDPDHPSAFWPWYARFFRHYFGRRQFATLAVASIALAAMLDETWKLLAFWALPAVLSSLQLFAFGTYLPHRVDGTPFADAHRARGSRFSWPVSLLTCFHFGHHHAHHARPGVPWWRLPATARQIGESQ